MRVLWRRLAGLALCACWLPLALRLLLLGRGYAAAGPPITFVNGQVEIDNDDAGGAGVDDGVDGEGRNYYGKYDVGEGSYLKRDVRLPFAGAYMAERTRGNVSYCRWQYELPKKLVYLEQQLISSPGAGPTGGPYGILPFAVLGSSNPSSLPQVTLCSHATADQVYNIVELARRWEGPLALSVFTPARDLGLVAQLLDIACHCEPGMSKVSVHLVFPRNHPPTLNSPSSSSSSSSSSTNDCSAIKLQRQANNNTDRHNLRLTYPINVARNVARSLAPTQRVLVSDIELLPSEKLASRFSLMLRNRSPKRALAFVLPVFEIEANIRPPNKKKQLMAAIKDGTAVYFHRFSCSHCQKFPGITRWLLRPDPGRVRPLIITRREYPHHRWEPIFIGTKHDPLYAEEMSWEGRQDKMTQMFEMCLMNYRLIILDGAFLVHTPGIKRKLLINEQQQQQNNNNIEQQRAQERLNARIYQRLTRKLIKQYPVNHRCKP